MTSQEMARLQEQFEFMLEKPIETTNHAWNNNVNDYQKQLLGDRRWGQHFRKLQGHAISQDNLPGEINFTTLLVPPKVPELIGRDLCPVLPVSEPTQKIPVFTKGESGESARGEVNSHSGSGRMSYINATLQESWNTSDTVDQDFLEDIQMGMIQYYWQELTRAHREQVSKNFIDFVCPVLTAGNKTDPSGNAYTIASSQVRGAAHASLDVFTDLYTAAKKDNWVPDCCVMTYEAQANFMKSNDFKSHDFFREFANYNNGMLSALYGMKIFVTNQLSGSNMWIFQKDQYAIATMRRDEMIVNLDDNKKLEQGLGISSRYGFAYRDASRVIYQPVSAPDNS